MIDQMKGDVSEMMELEREYLLCAEKKLLSNITFRKGDRNVYFKGVSLLPGKPNKMINLEPFLRGMI